MKHTGSVPSLRVYLIEDDTDLREEMVYSLSQMGFDITGMANAGDFYKAHAIVRCEIAVIDIGLPGEDGASIAAQLRSSSNVGIVMATALGAVDDRIGAIRNGADAYLVKPVNMSELAAIITALGARVRAGDSVRPVADVPQPWRLTEADWVLCGPLGEQLTLTTSERAFVACLFKANGETVSRDQLIIALGGDTYDFDPQRIDAIASRVRRKAERQGIKLPLHSVRGMGYMLAR
jgi:two-component system response regulator PhoP